jgi:hypothetical protein
MTYSIKTPFLTMYITNKRLIRSGGDILSWLSPSNSNSAIQEYKRNVVLEELGEVEGYIELPLQRRKPHIQKGQLIPAKIMNGKYLLTFNATIQYGLYDNKIDILKCDTTGELWQLQTLGSIYRQDEDSCYAYEELAASRIRFVPPRNNLLKHCKEGSYEEVKRIVSIPEISSLAWDKVLDTVEKYLESVSYNWIPLRNMEEMVQLLLARKIENKSTFGGNYLHLCGK